MPEVGFRYAKADLLKAIAERKGLALSAYLRSLADAALTAEGFSTASETQYALVSNGEFVQSPGGNIYTTWRLSTDPRGEWWPIVNVNSAPFDPAQHWRLKPYPLRIGDGQVIREYPVIDRRRA